MTIQVFSKRALGVLIITNLFPTIVGFSEKYKFNHTFIYGFFEIWKVQGILLGIILVIVFVFWCFGAFEK